MSANAPDSSNDKKDNAYTILPENGSYDPDKSGKCTRDLLFFRYTSTSNNPVADFETMPWTYVDVLLWCSH